MIDHDNLTIQSQNLHDGGLSERSIITKVTLHSHIKNKLPFENPVTKSDKIENFLHRQLNTNKKYSKIWYLELNTNDFKTYILTPLMLNINVNPFIEFEIVYDEDFFIGLKTASS
jgi:hypothetical protein